MNKLPDGPKAPAFLQQIHWIADPVDYMEAAARDYGDIFSMGGVGHREVFVSHPQALKQILTNDTKQFTAPGELNKVLQPSIGEHSVLLLSGSSHRRQRQLLMPPFHGDRMRLYGQLICNLASIVIGQLKMGQTFYARTVMQEIALQVILQTVFGVYQGERYELIKQGVRALLDDLGSPLTSSFLLLPWLQKDLGPWSTWGKFIRHRQQVDELIYAEIGDRRQEADPNRTDILSLLLQARDEAGQPMTDVELRDELMTLLIAGQETTATAMAWALYWIHHLPEVGKKLLAELDTLEENPSPTSIFQLPYLTAVCNETLRINSVSMLTVPRVVQEPVELLSHSLPPGTVVTGCIYLTHHREDLYPNPQQFQPDRFLSRQYSPYEFLPFGGGVRRCIGAALALYEMKLVLATIISKYQLELAEERPVKPQRRGITLAPAGGVKMVLKGLRDRPVKPLAATAP